MINVSVVVPCFRGTETIQDLVHDALALGNEQFTPQGRLWSISEIILVWDGGEPELRDVIAKLGKSHDRVIPVYQASIYGKHSATVGGMSLSTGDFVATLDEDGSHRPSDIGVMIDRVVSDRSVLCYSNEPRYPRSRSFRESVGRGAKKSVALFLGLRLAGLFQSFRLIHGDVARDIASRIGPDVYLDVALSWYAPKPSVAPVFPRHFDGLKSSYSFARLLSHFWMLFLTAGPAITKVMAVLGVFASLAGLVLGSVFALQVLFGASAPQGWASQIVLTLFSSGLALLIIGISAEYLGHVQRTSMGKPPFLLVKEFE